MNAQYIRSDFDFKKISLENFINLSKEELEMIRKWRNHKEVRKWMYSDHIISKEEHLSYINKLKKDNKNYSWLVKKEDNGLGVLNFHRVDLKNKHAYFGQYSNPEKSVPGLGWIVDKIAIKLAFNIIGLHTLKLEALADNKILQIHKKVGFQKEGRLKDYILKNNEWKDVVVMGLTEENKKTNKKLK